jgi:hypothetical protein
MSAAHGLAEPISFAALITHYSSPITFPHQACPSVQNGSDTNVRNERARYLCTGPALTYWGSSLSRFSSRKGSFFPIFVA